jgi:hypothetical protein
VYGHTASELHGNQILDCQAMISHPPGPAQGPICLGLKIVGRSRPQTIAAGYALLTVAAGCLYARTTRASFLCITMPLDCKRSAHTECKFVLTSKTSYGMIWARHVKTHNTLNEGSSYYQFNICTECICSLHEISHENSLHSEHTE